MIIEMNIEAGDLEFADGYVQKILPGGQLAPKTRVAIAKYEGPNGPEQTAMLVVRAVVPDIFAAMGYAYHFARMFGQDCIALYVPATQIGYLIGPDAAKWGEFDITFFKNF